MIAASITEVASREQLQGSLSMVSPSCLILQPTVTTQSDTSDSLQTVYTGHAGKRHCFSLFLSHLHTLLHEVSGELLLLCCSALSLFNEASLLPSFPLWLDCWEEQERAGNHDQPLIIALNQSTVSAMGHVTWQASHRLYCIWCVRLCVSDEVSVCDSIIIWVVYLVIPNISTPF